MFANIFFLTIGFVFEKTKLFYKNIYPRMLSLWGIILKGDVRPSCSVEDKNVNIP